MHKVIVLFNLMLLCLMQIACSNRTLGEKIESHERVQDKIDYLSLTPDSLLSFDLKCRKENLKKLIIKTLKVEGNKFVTTATVKDFEDIGFSKCYYDYLLKNIEEVNSMDFEQTNIQDVYDDLIESIENNNY